MKIKFSSNRFMSLFFLLLMIGSTASYAVVQSLNLFGTRTQNPNDIPKSNIINYDVKPNILSALVSSGFTVIKFYYTDSCTQCSAPKSMLESLANNNQNQVLLEELIDQNVTVPRAIVTSYKDSKVLSQPTVDDINSVLCDLMGSPPAELKCALRSG